MNNENEGAEGVDLEKQLELSRAESRFLSNRLNSIELLAQKAQLKSESNNV